MTRHHLQLVTEAPARPVRPRALRTVRPRPARPRVERTRLVARLTAEDAPPLAVLVAPAGYGKTMLLEQWAEADVRAFAWATLDERDNDPDHLLASVNDAVGRVPMSRADDGFVVVLDDVHVLRRTAARDTLGAIAGELPRGATLAVASRTEPPLPLARLRAQRVLTELRRDELRLTRGEAAALLDQAGVGLDLEGVDALVRRTEGWPVGLSLAALALAGEPDPGGAAATFAGTDTLVDEYLDDEILRPLPADQRSFLLRTSVLDTLDGPACDAVLDRTGSGDTLAAMARSNVLLVPLDRVGERYRCHGLFAEMLRARLLRTDPELVSELHRRAAAWHAAAGDDGRAVAHTVQGGDLAAAGGIVWSKLLDALSHGRGDAVARWLECFGDGDVAATPMLALAVAGRELERGRGDLAEHWASAAAAGAGHGDAALEAGVAIIRAALGRDGLREVRDDALRAYALQPEDSAWRTVCSFLAGAACHLLGDAPGAVRHLERAKRRGAISAPSLHALALAQLALIALDDEDRDDAMALIGRARSQVHRYGLGSSPASALVFGVSALLRAHLGRVEDARHDLRHATDLVAMLVDFAPWYEVEARLVVARAAVRLGDVSMARARIGEARRMLRRIPDDIVLQTWLEQIAAKLDTTARSGAPRDPLTAAELRILRFLPTHLSFREIGEHAYVTSNTVKTHANAMYRKLDVSSRSAAVARARELGLLDP